MSDKSIKSLVIFYSLEGNTRLIATEIAKACQGDQLELVTKEVYPTKGLRKYFHGGKQVIKKETPELQPLSKDPFQYDLIFIGTPVWASSFAPALRSFFSQYKLSGKKIALFCCYDGTAGRTFANFKTELAGNEFVGEIGFQRTLKQDPEIIKAKVQQWVKEILN